MLSSALLAHFDVPKAPKRAKVTGHGLDHIFHTPLFLFSMQELEAQLAAQAHTIAQLREDLQQQMQNVEALQAAAMEDSDYGAMQEEAAATMALIRQQWVTEKEELTDKYLHEHQVPGCDYKSCTRNGSQSSAVILQTRQ